MRYARGPTDSIDGSDHPSAPAFACSWRQGGLDAGSVDVTGELDMASAPELDACLLALADADVIVDLAGLTFMDSSGISVLIVAFKRSVKHGRTFVLRAPPAQVARVLQLSGTDQVFTIEPPD